MSGTQSIPASDIVSVTPNVLSAGGTALDLSGVILTTNTRVPIGTAPAFPSPDAVVNYFGATSQEAALAGVYFNGFDNSNKKPGSLLFYQYNTGSVRGYVRGGQVSGLTLTQLQALSGVLTIAFDGTPVTSSSINLSSATSFSSAAELMTIGLGTTGPAGAALTGSIAGTTLTVSAVSSGTIAVGQELKGAGIASGTLISAFVTGTGTTGTYSVSASQSVSSEAMTTNTPTVTYDSITGSFVVTSNTAGASSSVGFASGTLAAGVKLTSATGAIQSAGAVATTPATAMAALSATTQNWASFMTAFDPDVSGNANKQLFAAWANTSGNRHLYVAWDTDITPTQSTNATSSLGNILNANDSSGTAVIYSPTDGPNKAAFEMGSIASIDFTETNGRTTMAFRSQSGLTVDVTDQTVAANLRANGYSYYGRWATAADQFNFMYPGTVSGPFTWVDTYINQIWLNSQFQLALMVLLTQVKSIPYNAAGYGLIRAALLDPIQQGLNFGAFREGVTLSTLQKAEVNSAAGVAIDRTLSTQGWYLHIGDATPQVRQARASPPMTFWYMDGESVQRLDLASVAVQ